MRSGLIGSLKQKEPVICDRAQHRGGDDARARAPVAARLLSSVRERAGASVSIQGQTAGSRASGHLEVREELSNLDGPDPNRPESPEREIKWRVSRQHLIKQLINARDAEREDGESTGPDRTNVTRVHRGNRDLRQRRLGPDTGTSCCGPTVTLRTEPELFPATRDKTKENKANISCDWAESRPNRDRTGTEPGPKAP